MLSNWRKRKLRSNDERERARRRGPSPYNPIEWAERAISDAARLARGGSNRMRMGRDYLFYKDYSGRTHRVYGPNALAKFKLFQALYPVEYTDRITARRRRAQPKKSTSVTKMPYKRKTMKKKPNGKKTYTKRKRTTYVSPSVKRYIARQLRVNHSKSMTQNYHRIDGIVISSNQNEKSTNNFTCFSTNEIQTVLDATIPMMDGSTVQYSNLLNNKRARVHISSGKYAMRFRNNYNVPVKIKLYWYVCTQSGGTGVDSELTSMMNEYGYDTTQTVLGDTESGLLIYPGHFGKDTNHWRRLEHKFLTLNPGEEKYHCFTMGKRFARVEDVTSTYTNWLSHQVMIITEGTLVHGETTEASEIAISESKVDILIKQNIKYFIDRGIYVRRGEISRALDIITNPEMMIDEDPSTETKADN